MHFLNDIQQDLIREAEELWHLESKALSQFTKVIPISLLKFLSMIVNEARRTNVGGVVTGTVVGANSRVNEMPIAMAE